MKDGVRIFGWPEFYSNTPEEGILYLYAPAYVVDGKYEDIGVRGIMLLDRSSIGSIEFTNVDRESAKEETHDTGSRGDTEGPGEA